MEYMLNNEVGIDLISGGCHAASSAWQAHSHWLEDTRILDLVTVRQLLMMTGSEYICTC